MSDLVVLEFNEISEEVMRRMISRGQLPNFKRLIDHGKLATTTVPEEYSKLEPWIQWVTAHTGKSQREHKAFNLSDVQHTKLQQIWDVLEGQGISCGLVSPMNARRGCLNRGFFIPDPWTVSNETYPAALEPIYRFLAQKVQQHNVDLEEGESKIKFLRACVSAGVPMAALMRLGVAYVNLKLDRRNKWKLVAAFDRFLWDIAATLRTKFQTRYTAIFLNSVAHFQHHYWTQHEPSHWKHLYPQLFSQRNPVAEQNLRVTDDPISHGMQNYDRILGDAINRAGIDNVMVLTGLSQIPFEGYQANAGFYLYRPIDHAKLFSALHIPSIRIAPLMSRDVMIYFADDDLRAQAVRTLHSAHVGNQPLFEVTMESEHRLFVKVIYSYDIAPGAFVVASGLAENALKFDDHFLLITYKTGHHSAEGFVIAPLHAYGSRTTDSGKIPLSNTPEFVFRMLALANATEIAKDLSFSPV